MKKLYHFTPMILLTILLVILLMLTEAALYVKTVIFKTDIYADAMNEKEVAQAMFDEINTNFGYYIGPTGIPQEVFTSAYTKDELYTASFKLLTDSLAYITDKEKPKPVVTYDFSKIEKSITDYIEKDADARGIDKNNKEYKAMIASTVKLAKDQITSRLDVMMLYKLSSTSPAKTLHNHSELIGIAVWILIGAVIIILAIMIYIDRHHPRDLPYWAGTALVVSSGAILVPAVFLRATDYFESFFIKSEYIYRTVTGFFEIVLNDIIVFETVMLVIGLLLIISTQVIHVLYVRSLKKKHRQKKLFEHKADDSELSEDEHTPLLTAKTTLKPVAEAAEDSSVSNDASERARSYATKATTDEISDIIDQVLLKKQQNKN